MPRSSRAVIEETELRVMEVVENASSPRRPACFSLRALSTSLGVSPARARSALRRLVAQDLVSVEPRFADDGGQLANGYRLTTEGRKRLKARLEKGTRAGSGPALPIETSR